jgi:hypothetical protein
MGAWEQTYQEMRKSTDPATLREYLEQVSAESMARGQVKVLQMVMDLPGVGTKIVNMSGSL